MASPQPQLDSSLTAAGHVLLKQADEIVRKWMDQVAGLDEIPPAHRVDLKDHLPVIVKHIGRDLINCGEQQSEAAEDAAEKHGEQRWQLGWRLEEVVRDYQTLRPVLEQELRERLESDPKPEVMTAVATMVDEAITDSIRSYSEFADSLEQTSHQTAVELAAIVDSSTDAIIGMNTEGVIGSWNPAARRIYGYTAEEAIGQQASMTYPPERREELAHFLDTVKQGKSIRVLDTVRVTKGGKHKSIAISASPIRDRSGEVVGCATIDRDISDWVRSADALRLALEEAESANRAKSDFLANVSHELRTPMNAILGMTKLTLEEELDPVVRDNLETAHESANGMIQLIDTLLDVAKLEAGKLVLEESPFSLRHAMDDTMKLASVRAFQKGLEIACRIEKDVPDDLHGDATRLHQILTNLLSNAVKFTDEGQVLVEVRAPTCLFNRCRIEFRVTDTGVGISAEHLQQIFKPFMQVDTTSTRRFSGTGLGLSIASQMTELMGGELTVESTLGEGTTFAFSLPFARDRKAESEHAPPVPLDKLRDLEVLVVDDNETNRSIVAELLESWEMKPQTTDSAPKALALLQDAASKGCPFRLVLIDALMPKTDGFLLAEEIAREHAIAATTILMISPGDRLALRDRCDQSVADAFLDKPICQSSLFNTIVRTLRVATLGREADAPPVPHASRQKPLEILVAEDTPANLKLVERVLAKRGHRVTIANNGREAFELVREREFDLVLMDVQMPIMDGLQATAAIREAEVGNDVEGPIPIVAMTAHAMRGDRERCLAAGMTDYLQKPIDITRLVEIVERYGAGRGAAGRKHSTISTEQTSGLTEQSSGTTPGFQGPSAQDRDAADGESMNLEAALKRLRGDHTLLATLIACYVEDHVVLLEELTAAIEGGDQAAARRAAHSLKGLAANFDAQRTPQLAQAIEYAALAGKLEEAQYLLPRLQFAAMDLASQLQKAL